MQLSTQGTDILNFPKIVAWKTAWKVDDCATLYFYLIVMFFALLCSLL